MVMTSLPSNDPGARQPSAGSPAGVRVGHLYLDVQRRQLHCLNPAAFELHEEGVPFVKSDLARQRLFTLKGEPVVPSDLPLVRAMRQGEVVEADFLLPREEGRYWKVAWTATPFWDPDGQLAGVVGTVLCGPAEADTQRMAELAHDLRTPLQSLRLLCNLIEKLPPGDAEWPRTLESLRQAADRSVQIALDLLECCRGPVPRRSGERFSWFTLEPMLAGLAGEQAASAQAKGLTLSTDFSAVRGWQVYSDPVRIGRVLSNLLVNAVRYTHSGHVQFWAGWRQEADERLLDVSVTDTGPGISQDEQDSIFQPFERGQAGKQGDSGGSGLGLAVVDRLVEELGLAIEVYSQYGHGSAFHLLIPEASLRPPPPA